MKNRWKSVAIAATFAALLSPAGRVHAVCTTSLADTTSVDCKNAVKCTKAISVAAQKYVASFQTTILTFINKSQTAGLKAPIYRCIGGPNDGKKCLTHTPWSGAGVETMGGDQFAAPGCTGYNSHSALLCQSSVSGKRD